MRSVFGGLKFSKCTSCVTECSRALLFRVLCLESLNRLLTLLRSKDCRDIFRTPPIIYDEQNQPPEVFYRKRFLKNVGKFTGKHQCQSLFFNKVAGLRPETCNFIEKETLAQEFFREFCEILKNTFL